MTRDTKAKSADGANRVKARHGNASEGPNGLDTQAREGIARVVAPLAFKSWQGLYDYGLKIGDSEETARETAEHMHGAAVAEALTKADAILSLLKGMEGQGLTSLAAKDVAAAPPLRPVEQDRGCSVSSSDLDKIEAAFAKLPGGPYTAYMDAYKLQAGGDGLSPTQTLALCATGEWAGHLTHLLALLLHNLPALVKAARQQQQLPREAEGEPPQDLNPQTNEDRDTPPPPWPIGVEDNNNAKRIGWNAYFDGKRREASPFPVARLDLHAAFCAGWDAAESRPSSEGGEA